jgi:hypothetical protein
MVHTTCYGWGVLPSQIGLQTCKSVAGTSRRVPAQTLYTACCGAWMSRRVPSELWVRPRLAFAFAFSSFWSQFFFFFCPITVFYFRFFFHFISFFIFLFFTSLYISNILFSFFFSLFSFSLFLFQFSFLFFFTTFLKNVQILNFRLNF